MYLKEALRISELESTDNLLSTYSIIFSNKLFQHEDESQEDASIILLFEDVNYKEKSTSKLL